MPQIPVSLAWIAEFALNPSHICPVAFIDSSDNIVPLFVVVADVVDNAHSCMIEELNA